jgi:hypothetical protein
MKTAEETVAEILEHHGVKGMKWGVRRDRQGRDRFDPEGHRLRNDVAMSLLVAGIPVVGLSAIPSEIRVVRAIARNLTDKTTGYNKDGRWQKGGQPINLHNNPAKMKQYNDGFKKEVLEPESKKIRHADDVKMIEFDLERDALGYIVKVTPKGDSSAKQAEEFMENFLEHHGVKGMKWGVRKDKHQGAPSVSARTNAGVTGRTRVKAKQGGGQDAHDDALKVAGKKAVLKKSGTAALSNKDLQEIIERTRLEDQAKQAVQSKGRKFVTKKLNTQVDQQSQQFVQRKIKERSRGDK